MKNTKLLARIVFTIIAILLLTLICGCSDADSDNLKDTDEILEVNLNYSIVNDGGENYFVFDDPDLYAPLTIPDEFNISVMAPVAKFDSIGELVSRVKKGTLTEEQKRAIAQFDKDEEGRIQVCNIDKMYQPKLPKGCDITNVFWYGKYYTSELNMQNAKTGYVGVLTKDLYEQAISRDNADVFDNPLITVTRTEEDADGRKITHYSTSAGNFKRVEYKYSDGNRTLLIVEKYRLNINTTSTTNILYESLTVSESIPASIFIYGEENGSYFEVSSFEFTEAPTDDWALSFGIIKYVETEKS